MKLEIEIGKAILKLRKKKRKTQDKLASYTIHGRSYIGAVERGEKSITVRTLLNITNGLGIPLIDLLNEVDYDGISELKKVPRVHKKITSTKVQPDKKKAPKHRFFVKGFNAENEKKELVEK